MQTRLGSGLCLATRRWRAWQAAVWARGAGRRHRFRQRVGPAHMDSMAAGLFVIRQVVFQDAERFKVLLELEIDNLIADLHFLHSAEIVIRVRQSTSRDRRRRLAL